MNSKKWWDKIVKMRYDFSKKQITVIVIIVLILGRIFGRDLIPTRTPSGEEGNLRAVSNGSTQEICLRDTIKEAQADMGVFLNSMEKFSPDLKMYAVKKAFVDKSQKEHMWVSVTNYKDGQFYGVLDNEPIQVKNVRIGDSLTVNNEDVEDWAITSENAGTFNLEAGLYSDKCFKKFEN